MKANIGGGWPEDVDLPSYGGDLVEGEPVTIPGTGTFELIGITLHAGATHQKPSLSASHPTPICSTMPKNAYPPGRTLPPQDEH